MDGSATKNPEQMRNQVRVAGGALHGQINFTPLIVSSDKTTKIKHKSDYKTLVWFSLIGGGKRKRTKNPINHNQKNTSQKK